MNRARTATGVVTILVTLLGCSKPGNNGGPKAESPSAEKATFVNRVWRVAESTDVAPGLLCVFLSEGTLVFASPNGKPALGTWNYDGKSLTTVEEGIPYRVDILGLSRTEFRIRSHNPGGVVETRFVPAQESPLRRERP